MTYPEAVKIAIWAIKEQIEMNSSHSPWFEQEPIREQLEEAVEIFEGICEEWAHVCF